MAKELRCQLIDGLIQINGVMVYQKAPRNETKQLKEYLDLLKSNVYQAQKSLLENHKPVTAERSGISFREHLKNNIPCLKFSNITMR